MIRNILRVFTFLNLLLFSYYLIQGDSINFYFLILAFLASFYKNIEVQKIKRNIKSILILGSPFLLTIFYLIFIENYEGNIKHQFEVKLPLFLLPIGFLALKRNAVFIKLLNASILISLSIYGIWFLINSYLRLTSTGFDLIYIFSWGNTYYNFTMGHHPSYFTFLIFYFIIIIFFTNHFKELNIFIKYFILLFFYLLIILSLSRVFLLMVIPVLVLIILRSNSDQFKYFFLVALLISLVFVGNQNYVKDRLHNIIKDELTIQEDKIQYAGRLERWKCAFKIIHENPMGLGFNKSKSTLNECYKENGMTVAFEKNYNTHNEFLNFGIIAGIPGLILLLSFFIYFFINFYRQSNYGGLMFIITLFTFCVVENVFSINGGVMTITVGLCVFMYGNQKK